MPLTRFLDLLRAAPDRDRALQEYRQLAQSYDGTTGRILQIRQEAIASLQLQPGESVLDVACGTGDTLIALSREVGAHGRVVGVEQCPEMAQLARDKVQAAGADNNTDLVVTPAESLQLEQRFDAILMCFTHDVLQNPQAVSRVLHHARAGTRLAVAGIRWLPWWAGPINLVTAWRTRRYLTTLRGLRTPYQPLVSAAPDLTVVRHYLAGTCYRAFGTVRAAPVSPSQEREMLRADP